VPLALIDVRHTSTAFAGLALTAGTITWTIAAWLQSHYAKRVSPRTVIRLGLVLIGVGAAGMIVIVMTGLSVYAGPLIWAIGGFGIGLAYSTVSLVVLASAPPGQEGNATSAMQVAGAVGIAIATGVGGVLIDLFSTGDTAERAGIAWQFALMIGVLALAFLTAARLPSRLSQTAIAEESTPVDTKQAEALLTVS
jgi:MFS family permease